MTSPAQSSKNAWLAVSLVGAAVTVTVAVIFATVEEREHEPSNRVVYAEPEEPWDARPVLRNSTLGDWRRASIRDRTATSGLFLKQYNPRWHNATADTVGFYEAAGAHRNCVNAWTHKDTEYIGHLGGTCVVLDPDFTYRDYLSLDDGMQLDLETDMGPALFGPKLANTAWDALRNCESDELPESAKDEPAYEVFGECWRRNKIEIPPLKRENHR